jgi:protein-tyrosine-phosphatase
LRQDFDVTMPSVLFVCTANRFRSPIAAACFARRLQEREDAPAWSVGSAGTWAEADLPVIPSAQWMADHLGIDLEAHKSRRVDRELLARYDLILVMENSHREALLVEFPEINERLFLLAKVAAGVAYDVPDPVLLQNETFLDSAREISDLIDKGFEEICVLARRVQRQ